MDKIINKNVFSGYILCEKYMYHKNTILMHKFTLMYKFTTKLDLVEKIILELPKNLLT